MTPKVFLLALAVFCAASTAVSEAPDNRIMGGTPVTVQEFPYVAALVYFYPRPEIFIQRCVVAIVSSWHVLTTTYCFSGAELSNVYIRAGSTNSLSGGTMVSARDVVHHPDYIANPIQNDISVVFLTSPLPIGGTINALLLPAPGTLIPEDTTFRIVSWGFESETGTQVQTLRSIYLDNVNLAVCRAAYAGINVAIVDSVLCAARPGNFGTCRGDSGAPMVINNVLVGIASVYEQCGTDTLPDVFTRIDRYTNWILEVAQAPREGGVPVRVATAH